LDCRFQVYIFARPADGRPARGQIQNLRFNLARLLRSNVFTDTQSEPGHPAQVNIISGLGMSVWIFATAVTTGAQQAVLHGTITDADTDNRSPATVAITDAKGNLVTENDSFKSGFRCSGEFTKRLPPGRTRIRVTRGFETQFVEKELDLAAGRTEDVTFMLRRNIDLRRRGWYAGDSHVHMLHGERSVPVTFDKVAVTARTEDLQYLSLAQAWEIANPTPEALADELGRRSSRDCVLTWNLEAPKNYYKGDAGRCLGHCWNLGMSGRTPEGLDVIHILLAASAWDYESDKPTYANFESHRLVHAQGGAVFYTHPARWWMGSWGGQGGYPKVERMRVSNMAVELPLDTVLGPTFDGVDVITGSGELEANEKAFQLWTMLLNHGYRLAATGSSDACFDRPGGGVPGVPRTYTFVPDGFSLAKVTRATVAGHTFVTTGPLLIATVDGEPPGSAFGIGKKQHALSIEGWAAGDEHGGLDRVEILRNGQPFKEYTFSDQPGSIRTNFTFRERQSAWYCVRLWSGGAKHKQAISGAFYFGDGSYRPPLAVRAQVHAKIVDEHSSKPLEGSLTEVEFYGTLGHDGKRHSLRTGEVRLAVPGAVRLRAEAKGYMPMVLSPVLDNPQLISTVTGLSDADLLNWKTFERIRVQVSNVELVFRLQKAAP
jgi:hypothetical protein